MTTTAPGRAALAVLEMAQAGRFEEIRERFAPPLRPLVPAEALQAAWAAEIGRAGAVTLILQGGRDYQVTVPDDLAGWEARLAARPEVTIRVYDADNHLFFPGSGPPTPAEYEPAQHVDVAVVADIAGWLAATLPAPGAS